MIIRNLLYVLQLELYDIGKFLRFAYTHPGWWKIQKRARLVWTKKVTLVYALTVLMVVMVLAASYFRFRFIGLLALVPVIPFLPLAIAFGTFIVTPLDRYLKNRLIRKARAILAKNAAGLTVVGITGSYGKTTTKEILFAILAKRFDVVKTNENINTDVGIADFIIKNPACFSGKKIFIVEMGAYRRGDIKAICDLVRPDYAILTGINESHLERFGSLENIIRAKFELPESAKKMSVLNFDDENVKNNYRHFKIAHAGGVSKDDATSMQALDNFEGIRFSAHNTVLTTDLLALHNVTLILLAAAIARELGMAPEEIAAGVSSIPHIPHRLEPIYNESTHVRVIDDSYNGNYNGIVSGMDVLARAKGRKIVLTPGLVELGEKTADVHRKIGKLYAERNIDLVLLIKSKASDYIIEGLREGGFTDYHLFDSTEEAHANLSQIIKAGDTIIFQNDLPDNYF